MFQKRMKRHARKIIQDAYDLIKDRRYWTTGAFETGGRYCAVGALRRVSHVQPWVRLYAQNLLDRIAFEMYGAASIIKLNDSYGNYGPFRPGDGKLFAHGQVLNVMEEAIQRLTPPPPPLPPARIENVPEPKVEKEIKQQEPMQQEPENHDVEVRV